jgi:hypothetical protein
MLPESVLIDPAHSDVPKRDVKSEDCNAADEVVPYYPKWEGVGVCAEIKD